MKNFMLSFIVIINHVSCAFCQKPPIDTSLFGKWPSIGNDGVVLSRDGNYVAYQIDNLPFKNHTLIIQNTNSLYKKEYIGASNYQFSGDSKHAIFQSNDTLYFQRLDSDKLTWVANVNSYSFPSLGNGEWLAYQVNSSNKELVLKNILTGDEQKIPWVTNFVFDERGKVLLIKADSVGEGTHTISLRWINLHDLKATMLWKASTRSTDQIDVSDFAFDRTAEQVAFVISEKTNSTERKSIGYYKESMTEAVICADDKTEGIKNALLIAGSPEFSRNGKWLFLDVLEQLPERPLPNSQLSMVDVWSYKDLILQPDQARRLKMNAPKFKAVVKIAEKKVMRLEEKDELLVTYPDQVAGDDVVIEDHFSNNEIWWNWAPQPSFYLLSLTDGSRTLIRREKPLLFNFSFSPHGKYLLFYDSYEKSYFSYDTKTGISRNITKAIVTGVTTEYARGTIDLPVASIAAWDNQDRKALIYDNYDIWAVDLSDSKPPKNITNGYGKAHQVKLRLFDGPDGERVINLSEKYDVLLTAFNPVNKYNGFYKKNLNEISDPELLTLGPYTYYKVLSQKSHFYSFDDGMWPVKAREADIWIVKRQTASEFPNYFVTNDFKTFNKLTDLQPQKAYNWLTSELVTWEQADGSVLQGILYKPENFDPKRKYPVIFNYYEQLSYRLHEFPMPEYSDDNINIPWFVSNGYLVFTPDIKSASKSNKTADEWALNSVVSAARFLAKRPYIDSKKMAIQGHSFGGGETNYIVTHCKFFAAASEFAGDSDPLSAYLTLIPFQSPIEYMSKQQDFEIGVRGYGANPWQRRDLYSRTSAVLSADKATTPLLIVHNRQDNQIQWRQGIEMYLALRRLGKKVWMLQYDNGDHGVSGVDAVDYTIRLTQFFDYYLKRSLAPVWMTKGVSAENKGLEAGYKFDSSASIP
ncbi:MAG: prolyl oligopeptidase family serine peptidase [Puia sp.]|nr:prolyl oligopeptidase family serine peptidase [Puia sp.]